MRAGDSCFGRIWGLGVALRVQTNVTSDFLSLSAQIIPFVQHFTRTHLYLERHV